MHQYDQNMIPEHPIIEAISNNNHEQLKILLLSSSENINVIKSLRFVIRGDNITALDLAASKGDEITVELLLAHGAIPDYNKTELIWPNTTLSQAICGNNHKVIQLLVNNGCDPDTIIINYSKRKSILDTFTFNYWCKIVELNKLSMLQMLLEFTGRKISNDESSQKMLLAACMTGSDAIINYLLDRGVSIESKSDDERGWTCVFYAVAYYHYDTLQLLISRGANLKHKAKRGISLLHVAVYYYSYDTVSTCLRIIELLINSGHLDINATDDHDLTPIDVAVLNDDEIINNDVILLLLRQPDIDLAKADNDGTTVLHRAVGWANNEILQNILCRPDVDINARDKLNESPLLCYHSRKLDNISLLLDFGADTECLLLEHYNPRYVETDDDILKIFKQYQIKRKIANLSDDQNIDSTLDKYLLRNNGNMDNRYELMYSKEIQRMKETILCGKLTYYDFLHDKKRTCINVAKRPEMHDIFMKHKHGFNNYAYMLIKNYLNGSLSAIEIEAVNSAEDNLDVIFNNKLPNLVIHQIRKYIDIKDEVTVNNMKLLS